MEDIPFNHDFEPCYGEIVEIAAGIRRVVANNPGPFTGPGTGTYIVGRGSVGVIDPGPMIPQHVDAILDGLAGEHVSHIIVTHTHTDHSPASRLLQAKTGAAIFALGPHSDKSAGMLEGGVDRDFNPDFTLLDGEIIDGENWQLEAIHTPGHCANHLCFAMPDSGSLFCGDQLMAWATPVILPPDGSIADYLDSLDRLLHRGESTFYPTHGRPIENPGEFIQMVIRHRLQRVEQIRAALESGPHTVTGLRQTVYHAVSPSLYAGAELSVLASLEYLQHHGVVRYLSDNGETDAGTWALL